MDNQDKEIDLIEVFGNLFRKIYKNKILFISIVAVFVILGFVYNSVKKETFTYSTIATSSINKAVLLKYIDDLNRKNTEENRIIKKLNKVTLIFDEVNDNQDFFEVELILSDTTEVDGVLSEIIASLYKVDYIKKYITEEKKNILYQINNYSKEINKIDSIQKLIFSEKAAKSTIISTNGLSKEKIDFKNKSIQLENDLKEISALKIIRNNYYLFKSNKSLSLILISFLFLGVVFGILLIVIKK